MLPTLAPDTGRRPHGGDHRRAGNPVVFVVSADGALWENDPTLFPATGWVEISQPGGFTAISATKDAQRRRGGLRRHGRWFAVGERRGRRLLGGDIIARRIP